MLIDLIRVTDLYHNEAVLYKQLRPGMGTGSPYADCIVKMKVRIEIDGKIAFSHEDALSTKIDNKSCATYDLEEY